MYACSPLRQAVVTSVLCTSVGINQGEQSGLCHSVSDAYTYKLQTGHRCSSYAVLDHTDSPLSFAGQHTTL